MDPRYLKAKKQAWLK